MPYVMLSPAHFVYMYVNTFTNNYTIEMQHGEGYWIIIIVLTMKIAK